MDKARYRNQEHYIREQWSEKPKETFLALEDRMRAADLSEASRLLDVGCATGELLHFLATRFPSFSFTGVDVFDELLEEARARVPGANFQRASAIELPDSWKGAFDVVTAMGVLSIFDETEFESFWENLLRVTRDGGRIWVLAPLNEHGVDCMIRHRKRIDGKPLAWETGWNIHSQTSVAEALEGRCRRFELHPFRISIDLAPRPDPVRTWTLRTEDNERQLTNGMKLLIDHYFVEIEK